MLFWKSNEGNLEDLATMITIGASFLPLIHILKSFPPLVLPFIHKTSRMRPNTSECVITNGLFVCLPLSLENVGLSCCLSMHISQIGKDVGQGILLTFMSPIMLWSTWTPLPKVPPNSKTSQDLLPNHLAFKSLTLEFAWVGYSLMKHNTIGDKIA